MSGIDGCPTFFLVTGISEKLLIPPPLRGIPEFPAFIPDGWLHAAGTLAGSVHPILKIAFFDDKHIVPTLVFILLSQSLLFMLVIFAALRRKRLESALQLSESRYRHVIDSQHELVCRYLPDTTLTFVNEAYCRYFGRTREELLGKSFLELIPAGEHDALKKSIERLKANEIVHDEHQVVLPDGSIGWMHWEDHPVCDARSQIVEFQAVGRDVTKRKLATDALRQSEERFSGIFHASPEAISIIRRIDGAFLEVNPSWESFFEIPRHEAVTRTPVELGIFEDPSVSERFRQFLETGRSLRGFEHKFVTAGGRTKWTSVSCVLSKLDGVESYIVMNKDITLRREAEEAKTHLVHASKLAMLGELTASIAHEINQPLGAILSNTESAELLLESGSFPVADFREILSDIRRDNQRASTIIRKVRGLVGKNDMMLSRLEINDVIKDVESFITHDTQRHGIKLLHELSADIPPVMADRVQLEQVIMNLLLNAVDSVNQSPYTRRWIVIRSILQDGSVEVNVEDSGPGVKPEALARIFDSFFTTKSTGMGLGLALSRSIVEAHGGRLSAENSPETGAIFRIVLPTLFQNPVNGSAAHAGIRSS